MAAHPISITVKSHNQVDGWTLDSVLFEEAYPGLNDQQKLDAIGNILRNHLVQIVTAKLSQGLQQQAAQKVDAGLTKAT